MILYSFLGVSDEKTDSTGIILGLSLGLGIPLLLVVIYILYKAKIFKNLKQYWDNCTSSISDGFSNCFHSQPQPK